jgi:hypothetical protein
MLGVKGIMNELRKGIGAAPVGDTAKAASKKAGAGRSVGDVADEVLEGGVNPGKREAAATAASKDAPISQERWDRLNQSFDDQGEKLGKGLFDFQNTPVDDMGGMGRMMENRGGGLGSAIGGALTMGGIGGVVSMATGGNFFQGAIVGAGLGGMGGMGHKHLQANSQNITESAARIATQEGGGMSGGFAMKVMENAASINTIQQRHLMYGGAALGGFAGGGKRDRNHRRGFNRNRGNGF